MIETTRPTETETAVARAAAAEMAFQTGGGGELPCHWERVASARTCTLAAPYKAALADAGADAVLASAVRVLARHALDVLRAGGRGVGREADELRAAVGFPSWKAEHAEATAADADERYDDVLPEGVTRAEYETERRLLREAGYVPMRLTFGAVPSATL